MIKYLLDTNICIYIIRMQPGQVLLRLQQYQVTDMGISTITLSELEYGVAKSRKPQQNQMALIEFLASIEILPYDEKAAQRYGKVRADLERKGTPIGSLDMLIAAHALSLDCILVTNNESEFRRISGLKIENWTK